MTDTLENARALVCPQDGGGILVTVVVPTYDGEQTFTLDVQRSEDGDWRVFIPWSLEFGPEPMIMESGVQVANGIVYLGAPEPE